MQTQEKPQTKAPLYIKMRDEDNVAIVIRARCLPTACN